MRNVMILLCVLTMILLFLGCQDRETTQQDVSNNSWTIRAQSQIELQNQQQQSLDEQYVQNFIANENRYYSSDAMNDQWQQTVVIETHIEEKEMIR